MTDHSQEEEKPYQFKRVGEDEKDAEGKVVKRAPFKAFQRGTETLMEGFEDQEFGSPLEGYRFINAMFKEAEKKATETLAEKGSIFGIGKEAVEPEKSIAGDVATSKLQLDISGPIDAETIGRSIDRSLDGERQDAQDRAAAISKKGSRMFKIVIPKQSNTDMNRPVVVPNHQGGKDWKLQRGVEYIVPDYVVNILKESIATKTAVEFQTNPQGVRAVGTYERINRFSLNVLGEVWV